MSSLYSPVLDQDPQSFGKDAASLVTRLSLLCGDAFTGQAYGVDFFAYRLVRVRCVKSGGDEDAAELGGHVRSRPPDFGGVPGGQEDEKKEPPPAVLVTEDRQSWHHGHAEP
jgi:hypothetical protein